MSSNKLKKHVMSTDRLPFILLINIYLDVEQKN